MCVCECVSVCVCVCTCLPVWSSPVVRFPVARLRNVGPPFTLTNVNLSNYRASQ